MVNDDKRTVIFVGGTAYSGSTFFDMMLANDPKGFSCGEVQALFRPMRPHHIDPPCGCGDPECRLWDDLKTKGENRLYESIFQCFPNIRFIVDSSKDLAWITKQSRLLEKAGIDVKHVLIWKTPAEIAYSFKKRKQGERWIRSWRNYHRLYFKVISNFRAVPYSSLVSDSSALESVCRYTGIEYFPGKEEYWNKTHYTLFGNTSAKIHTRSKNNANYEKDMAALSARSGVTSSDIEKDYRKIYYHQIASMDPQLTPKSKSITAIINRIEECLRNCDVRHSNEAVNSTLNVVLSMVMAKRIETLMYKAKWGASLFGLRVLPRAIIFRLWLQRRDKK